LEQFPGQIVDIEYYLPEQVIPNEDLKLLHPDWHVDRVEKRTGVYKRHVARVGETAYDLSLNATKKLIRKYPLLQEKLDAVIVCTQSADYIMPSNAFLLHRDLGLAHNVIAFDYNLACSGYIYGLLIASGFLKTGVAQNILLVTGDTYSKYIDPNDRSTLMLFGDGASATWISNDKDLERKPLISSFTDFRCASDGAGWDKFYIKRGGNKHKLMVDQLDLRENKIHMDGLQVLNLVNDRVYNSILDFLANNQLSINDIDQFFLHQASRLAIYSLITKMNINPALAHSNLTNIGNTVSSSLPILLKDYFSTHSLNRGSKILLTGFGVGYSWGSLLASV
jgi:3-oxoacyl-[acyl-carrier-protein] synthase-3